MRRSRMLVAVVAVATVGAIGLRLHSHFGQADPLLKPRGVVGPRLASLQEPRDYVVRPWIHPDEVDRGPTRIISLAPSITEIVCALGLGGRLIGRTQFCRHPPGIESVEPVGALVDPNFDRIKGLSPDLVLTTSNSGRTIDRLGQLGVPFVAVPHQTLEEIYTAIERVGGLCDRPRTARSLAQCIRVDVESLTNAVSEMGRPPHRVLVALGDLPVPPQPVWAAGPGFFLDTLVGLAGHRNATADVLQVPHGELPLAKLVKIDPDVILTFGRELSDDEWRDLYRSWSQVGSLRAIRKQRVRAVGGGEWLSAGPRVAIGLHRFISVLSEFE